jgi:restriction system protein
VHRRGQEKGVNVYSYWISDTIDKRIYEILAQKGQLITDVVDGLSEEDVLDRSLTIDDLLGALGIKQMITSKKPTFDPTLWQSMEIDEIQNRLFELTPKQFEELVKNLMHYLGYPNVKVTGQSHDGGIDVISTRTTEKGIERVAAQCKRYKANVGVRTAREFIGSIQTNKDIVKGYLVTTSEFTQDCLRVCEQSGMIRTINGLEVAWYVKQFGLTL